MGGIRTDLEGRTSLPGLYAAGEVACTGVHGANRLASNSLLEGVVFGARAGRAMRESSGAAAAVAGGLPEPAFPCVSAEEIRALAWERCGVVRSGAGLEEAVGRLEGVRSQTVQNPNRGLFELRSMHAVVSLIARCALARRESRGAHYRTDFPDKAPEFQKHSVVSANNEISFV
jgi:L-aspartate oxidase